MNIIIEYFNCELLIENGKPKIHLKLKDEKKITKKSALRPDGYPYSFVNKEYFVHFLGETDIALEVWKERKKLSSKNVLIEWYIQNHTVTDEIKKLLYDSIKASNKKLSDNLKKHYASDAGIETKEKLKARTKKWSAIIGEHNKNLWKDDNYRVNIITQRKQEGIYQKISESCKKKYNDPSFKKFFIEEVARNPERIKKISESSKKMWVNAKKNSDKYFRMINTAKHKKYELNGIKLNHIEYIVGDILTEYGIVWEHERIFNIENHTYLPDFFLPDYNIIIECYGDFWHANPKEFLPNDTTHKNRTAIDIWKYDDNKKLLFEQKNYLYLYFWETEILNEEQYVREQIRREVDRRRIVNP